MFLLTLFSYFTPFLFIHTYIFIINQICYPGKGWKYMRQNCKVSMYQLPMITPTHPVSTRQSPLIRYYRKQIHLYQMLLRHQIPQLDMKQANHPFQVEFPVLCWWLVLGWDGNGRSCFSLQKRKALVGGAHFLLSNAAVDSQLSLRTGCGQTWMWRPLH